MSNRYPDDNPKTVIGLTKPSVSKVPPAALFRIGEGLNLFNGLNLSDVPSAAILYMSVCMMDGARKYGPYNWREKAVTASIYVDATMRHILAFQDGEDVAADSGRPHLGHALASLGILIDAEEYGNLIDDRPPPQPRPFTQPFNRFEKLLQERVDENDIWVSDCLHVVTGNLLLWWDTRERPNTKLYLGAAITGLAILVEAIETGKVSDDRRMFETAPLLIEKWTESGGDQL